MGVVHRPLVRRPDCSFTAGLSDSVDDENTLTQVEEMISDESFE